MRGITCRRGRGERCGIELRAGDDQELLAKYEEHVGAKHPDLQVAPFEFEDDIFVQAYDVDDHTAS